MDRTLRGNVAQNYGLGRVYMEFLFQTNNTSSPLLSTVVGVTSGAAVASQGPPPVVASITRSGVGVLVVQFSSVDTFNKVLYAAAELDDTANDGAFATTGNITNEGSSSGIAFTIRTRAVGGVLTDYAARTVRVAVCFRNTVAGQ